MVHRISLWTLFSLFCGISLSALGQETPVTASSETVAESLTNVVNDLTKTNALTNLLKDPQINVQELISQGGFLVYLLFAMSVALVALVVFFSVSLNGGRVTPRQFVQDINVMLRHSRFEEARVRCKRNSSAAAAIALAALEYVEVSDDPDQDMLREVIEGEGIRQAGRLQTQVNYLLDIGVIAPMVGLLGTVMGMLRAFNSIAHDIAKAAPVELAYGVSQALVTTAAGLFVAIPAMIAYAMFRGRVAKLTANLELVATEFVTTLLHRKTK